MFCITIFSPILFDTKYRIRVNLITWISSGDNSKMNGSGDSIDFNSRDLRVVIAYNFKRSLSPQECHHEINTSMGDNTVSYSMVTKWYREFGFGRTSLNDAPRTGRPIEVTTDVNVATVRDLIATDPRMTICQMAAILKISEERVHHILHHYLNARYVCVHWVPHQLTSDQMATRVKICKENLKKFRKGGNRLFSRLVTGDETWVYYYDTPSNKEAKLWVIEDESIPTMAKREMHVKKVMYAVFFRSNGLVKIVKLPKGQRVTAHWYSTVCLPQVFDAIREDRPKSGLKNIVLHHDNARPHTAALTREFLEDNGVVLLTQPPYSPDLAPCDFWLFRNLKKFLRGKRFNSEEEIDCAIQAFFETIPLEAWRRVYDKWSERMNRVIRSYGDYIC